MPRTSAGGDARASGDDGWGAATTVRGGSRPPGDRSGSRPPVDRSPVERASTPRRNPPPDDDGWSAAGPASPDRQRSNRQNQRANDAAARRTERSLRDLERHRDALSRPPERGLRARWALLVVVVLAVLGGLIDTIGAIEIQGGFNGGIIVASIVGILIVKRSQMFPVVIAPPIVYTIGAGFQYYVKASSGNASKAKLDAAANYLVYGFPAIAAATAAVLIIAGIRMIIRK